jgi:transcriptional regulator with PAS, ATPase and Fis domain
MKTTNAAARIHHAAPETFLPESGTGVRTLPFAGTLAFPECHRHLGRSFGRAIGASAVMADVFALLMRLARKEVTVTLLGETGTGKDVLARSLHDISHRAAGPFVVFDCGAVAATLAESELFGHERGAFTGAVTAHTGAFERAHQGTLFLDEVAELPLSLQPRLLRALDERSVRRVGGAQQRPCDARIVAATNRDLCADVRAGKFREDLYFRLATAVVRVPPLRERPEDLDVLVPRLLADLGCPYLGIADETFAVLRSHPWPGNVRELKNILACALAFIEPGDDRLEPRHLRFVEMMGPVANEIDRLPLGGRSLESIEKVAIAQTLAQSAGNKVRAAYALGVAVSTLYEKLKRHGI